MCFLKIYKSQASRSRPKRAEAGGSGPKRPANFFIVFRPFLEEKNTLSGATKFDVLGGPHTLMFREPWAIKASLEINQQIHKGSLGTSIIYIYIYLYHYIS